jgi:hypothetical protein
MLPGVDTVLMLMRTDEATLLNLYGLCGTLRCRKNLRQLILKHCHRTEGSIHVVRDAYHRLHFPAARAQTLTVGSDLQFLPGPTRVNVEGVVRPRDIESIEDSL